MRRLRRGTCRLRSLAARYGLNPQRAPHDRRLPTHRPIWTTLPESTPGDPTGASPCADAPPGAAADAVSQVNAAPRRLRMIAAAVTAVRWARRVTSTTPLKLTGEFRSITHCARGRGRRRSADQSLRWRTWLSTNRWTVDLRRVSSLATLEPGWRGPSGRCDLQAEPESRARAATASAIAGA